MAPEPEHSGDHSVARFVLEYCDQTIADLRTLDFVDDAEDLEAACLTLSAGDCEFDQLHRVDQQLARLRTKVDHKLLSGFDQACWKEMYVMVQCFIALKEMRAHRYLLAVQAADRAIISGAPSTVFNDLIDTAENALQLAGSYKSDGKLVPAEIDDCPVIENPLETVDAAQLSPEQFRQSYVKRNRPVLIRNGEPASWPALMLWSDLRGLRARLGHRLVPIEIGNASQPESFSEKIVSIADFIDDHLTSLHASNLPTVPAYLAQHPLFDQIQSLRDDFQIPNYVTDSSDVTTHAWFGNSNTATPLHYDGLDNVFVQVVGAKKFRLYDPSQTRYLYRDKRAAGNAALAQGNVSKLGTSAENPDFAAFPKSRAAVYNEVIVRPGDMLYIPQDYWHFVRALPELSPQQFSFSVSFFF